MKTKRFSLLRSYVLMAVCAALFANSLSSCYKEAPANEEPLSGKWNVCIPAALDQNPDTRAVVYQDGKLTAEFRQKDNIYVIKNGAVDSNPLHPDADGPKANLVGYLENSYSAGDKLTLLYNTKNDGTFSFKTQTGGQVENGELNKFDYAVATVTVTSASDGDITTTPALFRSLQSMYKFTFVDEAGDPVKVTKLLVTTKSGDLITATNVFGTTVNKGSVTVDIAYEVNGIADGVVWVALSKAGSDADTFIFDAIDNDNNLYMGTLDVAKGIIQNGKFYTATITLTKQETDPLTLEAIEAGTITIKNPLGLVISCLKNMDTRVTSLEGDKGDIEIAVTKGDVVRFYGDNPTYVSSELKNTHIDCSSDCYIYGNIMSLIDSNGYDTATTLTDKNTFLKLFEHNEHIKNKASKPLTLPATTLTEACYSSMFWGCKGLTTAPELPSKSLAKKCYSDMFGNCTGLTTAPQLPATTLAEGCYSSMFSWCTSLGKAPELPAETLAKFCYNSMFVGCESLTTTPKLPATTLTEGCYFGMFAWCTSLNSVTCLATDISADNCTTDWLDEVASNGTFCKAASMSEDDWRATGIPSGWTVKNDGE